MPSDMQRSNAALSGEIHGASHLADLALLGGDVRATVDRRYPTLVQYADEIDKRAAFEYVDPALRLEFAGAFRRGFQRMLTELSPTDAPYIMERAPVY